MEKPFDQLRQGMQSTTDEWIARGGEYINEMFATTETSSVLDDTMKDLGDLGILLKDKTIKSFDEFTQKIDIFNDKLPDTPTQKSVSEDGVPIEVVKTGNDVASLPGQNGRILTGDFGSLSLNNKDLVVAGDPNKLIGGDSSNSKIEFGSLNISGRIELVSPDGSTNSMDMSSLKPSIEKIVINHLNGTFRNGGVPSSKESTDYMRT
jgi:hypothetical protein